MIRRHRPFGLAEAAVWALAVATIPVFIVATVRNPAQDPSASFMFFGIVMSLALVGALLMTRVPGNRIGAMLLTAGILLTVGVGLGTYATLGAQADPAWPGAALAGLVADSFYVYSIAIALIGIPLVFPDGHLPSFRFRWIAWCTVAAMAAVTTSALFYPGTAGASGLDNPFGNAALVPLLDALTSFANLSAIFGFGGAAAAMWVRFRRGDPIVREQTKWLLATAGVATIAFPVAFALGTGGLADGLFLIGFLALLALPLAIGVAVLRYRLYEIDRIVSRTIAYAIVSVILGTAFFGSVLLLSTTLSRFAQGETIAVAASTLCAFAAFQPILHRVRRDVDRRFNRASYDAGLTAAAFSTRLRDQVDIAAVAIDLDETVRGAVKPAALGLWIRGPGRDQSENVTGLREGRIS